MKSKLRAKQTRFRVEYVCSVCFSTHLNRSTRLSLNVRHHHHHHRQKSMCSLAHLAQLTSNDRYEVVQFTLFFRYPFSNLTIFRLELCLSIKSAWLIWFFFLFLCDPYKIIVRMFVWKLQKKLLQSFSLDTHTHSQKCNVCFLPSLLV